MNQTRTFLVFALLFVAYLLWTTWQSDYATAPVSAAVTAKTLPTSGNATPTATTAAPAPMTPQVPEIPAVATPEQTPGQQIHVRTDLLDLGIDTRGGTLDRAELLDYAVEPGKPARVDLLHAGAADYFVAQSGLVSATDKAPDHNAVFRAPQAAYTLAPGQNTLNVDLTWTDAASGVSVLKRYTFTRGSYVVTLTQQVINRGRMPWAGNAYEQLTRVAPPAPSSHLFGLSDPASHSYNGPAWYGPADKFQKLPYEKVASKPLDKTVSGGWVAMVQHYFLAAWIPGNAGAQTFQSAAVNAAGSTRYVMRTLGPAFTVAPGQTVGSTANLFVGPKLQNLLQQTAPGLELTVDYGMFTVLAQPLHWVLVELHRLTRNWGLAIILLVLLIKAVFFKLSEKQYTSAAKMRKLAPRIQALKERYGDDKVKMQQSMMELYQKEKANPLAGCWPMLVQIPVFFALYWVLLESVELRQAPFFGWLQNLSAPDPYFVLPILNAAVMLAQQFLTPMVGMDPTQAKIMKAMPLLFAFMFAFFPSGLVLYWVTNGLTGLLQQWFIMRRYNARDAKAAA